MKKLILPLLVLLMMSCVLVQGTRQTGTPTQVIPSKIEPAPTQTFAPTVPAATPEPSLTPTLEPTIEPVGLQTPTESPAGPAKPHFKAGQAIKFKRIDMITALAGWGVSDQYLLTTQNGGTTWREVTPPQEFPPDSQVYLYAAFPNEKTAWVAFSVDNQIEMPAFLWITQDGGKTWRRSSPLTSQITGDYIWIDFACLNAQEGWIVVRGVYLGAGSHYSAQFFHTTDGAMTAEPLNDPNSGDTTWAFAGDITNLTFLDSQNGWVAYPLEGAYLNDPATLGVTTNGGKNWEDRELPPPANAPDLYNQYYYSNPGQINAITPSSLRLWVSSGNGAGQEKGFLYKTEDGGNTWQTSPLPVAPDERRGDRMIFFDANNAILLGPQIFKTTDAGISWTPVAKVNWDRMQFDFVDPKLGWGVVSIGENPPALVQTKDGGSTWQILQAVIGG